MPVFVTTMFLGDKDPAGHRVSEAEYVARCTVVIPLSREQQQPSLSAMESNPNSIQLADKDNTPPPAPTTQIDLFLTRLEENGHRTIYLKITLNLCIR